MVTPKEEELRSQKWMLDKITDIYFAPLATQESIDKGMDELRGLYIAAHLDGIFQEFWPRLAAQLRKSGTYGDQGMVLRAPYVVDDFLTGDTPYREIMEETNDFKRQQLLAQIGRRAREVGVKNFKALWERYFRDHREKEAEKSGLKTTLDEKEYHLGEWHLDEPSGRIYRETVNGGVEIACAHPITPIRRIEDIDTGQQSIEIAYERGGKRLTLTRPKRDLYDASKVLDLAECGISVTSKTAKLLAEYLCDVEDLNYDEIPTSKSTSRLGFVGDEFAPYIANLEYGGGSAYQALYSAIHKNGDFDAWRKEAVRCRSESITAQIMLAASFASPLVEKLGTLCFFVHLWGIESETGKTVALMLAASVWGDPEIGAYPQTFNATQVGHEKTAAFLHNIPLCIDELQLNKDAHGRTRFDVYQLAQGVGRTRGNKQGGIDRTPTWKLCVLTTGETPIVNDSAGAGAYNRVIDIECRSKTRAILDGQRTANTIKRNYGHAGEAFVAALTPEKLKEAEELYQRYFAALTASEKTAKQAMSAALIMVADKLADDVIYHTGKHLTVEQMGDFVKTSAEISAGKRGYEYICDWVAQHAGNFADTAVGDRYGILDGDKVFINRAVFNSACREAGYEPRALLSWLRAEGKIETRGNKFTVGKRISGILTECVKLELADDGSDVDPDDNDLNPGDLIDPNG